MDAHADIREPGAGMTIAIAMTWLAGAEPPFTGAYWDHDDDGTYRCVSCATVLFDSRTKIRSGLGWPSFLAPVTPDVLVAPRHPQPAVGEGVVHCARCNTPVGHVIPNGVPGASHRFAVGSVRLEFDPR